MMNILILGGTSEASELVRLLAGRDNINVTMSLAGRTKAPVLPNVNCRIGGFGGAQGLADYIKEHKINALVCATHPFAARMPFNAALAAEIAGVPLLFILRPEWQAQEGDNWIAADSHKHVINLLNSPLSLKPKAQSLNIFLTVGRLEIKEYEAAPQHHYIVRSIDEITEKTLRSATYITARPPLTVESELELLKTYKIDYIISKNSGGAATEAKLTAAREIGIPIIMISRPLHPAGEPVQSAKEAIDWLNKLA